MANSALSSLLQTNPTNTQAQSPATQGLPVAGEQLANTQQMINRIKAFKQAYKGNPKQAVMQMLQSGQINNTQLQQAMQMANQLKSLF